MKLTDTKVFRLSIISSLLLFISVMYSNTIGNIFWQIAVILLFVIFFGIMLCWSIIFWINKKTKRSYIPFVINFLFFLMVVELPLNWIRTKAEFELNKNEYEAAAKFVTKVKLDSTLNTYQLPDKYRHLSAGGGEVYILKNSECKVVLFYTLKGDFEVKNGYAKVLNDKSSLECFINEFGTTKNLGNNWYYVSTE